MAENHWQVINWNEKKKSPKHMGDSETLSVEEVPLNIINTAVRASRHIGDGLYGVDLKVVGKRCFVIEVNDNPSIDSGLEDAVLKDELYSRIMNIFFERVKRIKENHY
jgi:glutathione synthase/RimK-type ligase-like ATP-grasp enzyme